MGHVDPGKDAYGRLRTAEPQTLWESKMLIDNAPLFWDDQETSGGGTGSSYTKPRVRLSVSGGTSGVRVRQTFQRFNYQPGKSQQMMATFTFGPAEAGVTKRVGLFDSSDGFYVEQSGTSFGFGLRSAGTDTFIGQDSWSIRPGRSRSQGQWVEPSINPELAQIFVVDYEWLGVGTVRYGFVIEGEIVYYHEEHHANETTGAYISTPNLPMRYEIGARDTGHEASYLDQICNTIVSEGGQQDLGILRYFDRANAVYGPLSSGKQHVALGLRLNPSNLDSAVILESLQFLTGVNDQAHWSVYLGGDISSAATSAGTTWVSVANSPLQTFTGTTRHTHSSGTELYGGYMAEEAQQVFAEHSLKRLGSNIAGTPENLWLIIRGVTANINTYTAVTWREI